MKAILFILVIALGGAAYWFQRAAGVAETRMIAAEDAAHEASEARAEAEQALGKAAARVAELEGDVSKHLAEIDLLKRAEIVTPVPAIAPDLVASEPQADRVIAEIEAKEADLKRIYDQHLATIAEQRATLTANLGKAQAIEQNLRDNPPVFAEQGKRTNAAGTTTTVGVRTSAADRKVAMDKHQEELAKIATQIAAIRAEQLALEDRAEQLYRSYNQAVDKLRD